MAIFLLAKGMAVEAEADADADADADTEAVVLVVVVRGGTVDCGARRRSQCLSSDMPMATGKAARCRHVTGLYTTTQRWGNGRTKSDLMKKGLYEEEE